MNLDFLSLGVRPVMTNRKTKKKLDVSIRKNKKGGYRLEIDGDVFWSDTYEHALHFLMYILCRDELKRSSHPWL